MNWKEQVMANMIQDWVMSPKKHTYRIHISHNDMDGYACHLVTDIFGRYLYSAARNNKDLTDRKTIYHVVTEVNPDSVKAAIESAVKHLVANTDYYMHDNTISFLITDIGGFDPDEMFKELLDKGYTINYLVVDHHMDFRKIGERDNVFKTQVAYGNIYRNGWFSVPGTGACELLLKAFTPEFGFDVNQFLSGRGSGMVFTDGETESDLVTIIRKKERYVNGLPESVSDDNKAVSFSTVLRNLSGIIRNISKSDVGEWDALVDGVPGPILAQRLIWSYYTKIPNGPERWYADTMEYLMDTTTKWWDIFHNIIETEAEALMEERDLFDSSIVFNMNDLEFGNNTALWNFRHGFYKFIDSGDEAFKDMDKSCFVLLRDDSGNRLYPNYSILAKWFMKDHPNCYFMFGIDATDEEVSMRSFIPEANCAKIATAFGGGGHIHAAGFKMKNFGEVFDKKFGS